MEPLRETIALKRRMEELIAQHSGQPLEKVSKDMERDYFMTAEEAVVYGIIDRVLTHRVSSRKGEATFSHQGSG